MERGGINMCKAIKELIAEGVSQGIERGIDDGIALMKAVLRLHAQGVSDTRIAQKCGISVEKVKYILAIPKHEMIKLNANLIIIKI